MKPAYLSNYLQILCTQNRQLFDSPFVWQFHPEELPLDPKARFPQAHQMFLEIGFGHGEVLEEMVRRYPDTGFVGIERRPARVRKALKRLHRIGRTNSVLIRSNLDLLDRPLFVENAFDQILVNHPDPWPKRRHEHHRFFRSATMDWFWRIMVPGGSIEVTSDLPEYFFHILHLFEMDDRFESLLPPPLYRHDPEEGRPVSRFEKHTRAAGKLVRLLRFKKQ